MRAITFFCLFFSQTYLFAQPNDSLKAAKAFRFTFGLKGALGSELFWGLSIGTFKDKWLLQTEISKYQYIAVNLPVGYSSGGFLGDTKAYDKLKSIGLSLIRKYNLKARKYFVWWSVGTSYYTRYELQFENNNNRQNCFICLSSGPSHHITEKTSTGLGVFGRVGIGRTRKYVGTDLAVVVHLNNQKSYYGVQLILELGKLK